MTKLTPDDLIYGYINGIFPMADSDGTLYWYSPDPRAIIPIETYKPHKSLRPLINKQYFDIRFNTNFEGVMRGCAMARSDSDDTWISEEIIEAYSGLNAMGLAHSVEAYVNNTLVGGLYGVAIGSAFFGESMFYTEPNASKVAFHYLIQTLRNQSFELLDTQFINDNVRRFGAIEIPKFQYLNLLKKATAKKARFIETEIQHFFSKIA
ncbi:Leucyl/phenylalanyl-tRNA--protein transferase [Emticicia aquatica]|jgi:leucyl/phenylalanyl-tRNA--protein transferase|uniref:Leucyl/phenylalanyl-tRNA--protein transferase n=1 Tax=Emticicia aquatica TaxID=1681835 RepID=A0ABM9AS12_9BACT|nr:leucyl/phenylalanyl-tRNA--protein transferase [Emticicia aquatica]CAH0996697.1 Leucyl/phenylalanyl-tRNA--protein transferase [Emticicia aquatica]